MLFLWNCQCRGKSGSDRKLCRSFQKAWPAMSARQAARVVGKVTALAPAIGRMAFVMTRKTTAMVEARRTWDRRMDGRKFPGVGHEWKFWAFAFEKLPARSLVAERAPNIAVCSDASARGAAAVIEARGIVCHKFWSDVESKKSSAWRELEALRYALDVWGPFLARSSVFWRTDAQNVVSICRKGSMKDDSQRLMCRSFHACREHDILLQVDWIPRKLNETADFFSKWVDVDDWQISESCFRWLDFKFGPHTLDAFANSYNAKVARFRSKLWVKGSTAIDAFSLSWSEENMWLVPPIPLVGKVLTYLRYCKGKGTLLVPEWRTAAFWPILRSFSNVFCRRAAVDDRHFGSRFQQELVVWFRALSREISFHSHRLFNCILNSIFVFFREAERSFLLMVVPFTMRFYCKIVYFRFND